MDKVNFLFEVTTHRLGNYYVIANSWDDARNATERVLNDEGYSLSDYQVTGMKILAYEGFFSNGKRYIDNNLSDNNLIVAL